MTALTPALWPAAGAAEEVARSARTAHVAVDTRTGPHTTPVAVTWSAGRLWFATPRRSVKARAAAEGHAGALLRHGDGVLLLSGPAEVVDPLRPLPVPWRRLARLGPASARYLLTQRTETLAIARDAIRALARDLDLAPLAPRAAIAIQPRHAVLLSGGGALEAAAEQWGAPADDRPRVAALDQSRRATARPHEWAPHLDADLAAALRGSGPAVVTVATAHGPLPLPAEWDGHRETARLTEGAIALLPRGAWRLPACVTMLARDEPGLAGKAGLLLRGAAAGRDQPGQPRLWFNRLTWWRGAAAGTIRAGDLEEVRRRHAR